MQIQLCHRKRPRRHGETPGSDRPRALHIQRRISNHHDLVAIQLPADKLRTAITGDPGDFIARVVIVRESAQYEFLPQSMGTQFDFCTQPDVAGQQADGRRLWQPAKFRDELVNSGQRLARMLLQQVIQKKDIRVEEMTYIFKGVLNAVLAKEFTDQTRIRTPMEGHTFGSAGLAEQQLRSSPKSAHTRASGPDERAIDIKQDESYHGSKLAAETPGRKSQRADNDVTRRWIAGWRAACCCRSPRVDESQVELADGSWNS